MSRSIGHAVATAQRADHSLITVECALKVVKLADTSIDKERKYQDENLSCNIVDLVITAKDK